MKKVLDAIEYILSMGAAFIALLGVLAVVVGMIMGGGK